MTTSEQILRSQLRFMRMQLVRAVKEGTVTAKDVKSIKKAIEEYVDED